jgi:hypothetical protein
LVDRYGHWINLTARCYKSERGDRGYSETAWNLLSVLRELTGGSKIQRIGRSKRRGTTYIQTRVRIEDNPIRIHEPKVRRGKFASGIDFSIND